MICSNVRIQPKNILKLKKDVLFLPWLFRLGFWFVFCCGLNQWINQVKYIESATKLNFWFLLMHSLVGNVLWWTALQELQTPNMTSSTLLPKKESQKKNENNFLYLFRSSRIQNLWTCRSRVPCRPSSHLLRPQHPSFSVSCFAPLMNVTKAMLCSACWISLFPPNTCWSLSSRLHVWVKTLKKYTLHLHTCCRFPAERRE